MIEIIPNMMRRPVSAVMPVRGVLCRHHADDVAAYDVESAHGVKQADGLVDNPPWPGSRFATPGATARQSWLR